MFGLSWGDIVGIVCAIALPIILYHQWKHPEAWKAEPLKPGEHYDNVD